MVFDLNVSKSNSKNIQYRNRLFTINNPQAENKSNTLLLNSCPCKQNANY